MDRARRREEIDEAYQLQVQAAKHGAIRYGGVGIGLAVLGHYSWPLFRKQTLAFKAFLVTTFTVFGLVIAADTALLSHESERRVTETALRRAARIDLARRGLLGTETEIAKWKAERLAQMSQSNAGSDKPPQT